MVVLSSSVNIERLKDGNVEMDTRDNIYILEYDVFVSVKPN